MFLIHFGGDSNDDSKL